MDASAGSVLSTGNAVFAPIVTTDKNTGRFTYQLGQGALGNLNFVGYVVDATHLLTMSTDSHQNTYLLSGKGAQ